MAMAVSGGRWTRVRTLGRGASGAEVFLAADHDSRELFAVKSASAGAAELLRRERGIMAGLRSPHVVPCIGGRDGRDGSYSLFLEFAPGGSLADAVARNGGRGLEERAVAAYAADVAAGLAYVHGAGLVHGDVKPRNVVIGGDGRAKLADFGCARSASVGGPIGGTPAFMAPEVARAEAQGPPADVWALGCTVIEMATGRAPWAGVDDVLAAVRLIGYTDAVPEVPRWLSAEAKDFLGRCHGGAAAPAPVHRLRQRHHLRLPGGAGPRRRRQGQVGVTQEHARRGILGVRQRRRRLPRRGVGTEHRREDRGAGLHRFVAAGVGLRRVLDRRALRTRRSIVRRRDERARGRRRPLRRRRRCRKRGRSGEGRGHRAPRH